MGNESGVVVVVHGMRPLYSVQEEPIAQRILQLRKLHLRVLRKDISVCAKEEITDPTFHASAGCMGCSFHEALGICHTAKNFIRTTPAPGLGGKGSQFC